MDKNIEILSQQDILAEYKNQLNALKMEVNQNKKISYDDVKTLIDGLPQTYKEAYKAQIEELETKLSSNETISSKDISFLFGILENLEKQQLSQEQLKAMNEALSQVKKTKSQLTTLRNTIQESPEIKKVKEKIEKYKNRLVKISTEHPIWTKVLISMLPDNLKTFFVKKETKINVGGNGIFGEIKAMIEQVKQAINSFLVPLLAIFFNFIAPKEIKQLYAEMKDDFSTIKPELLAKVGVGSMADVTEKVADTKEKLEEDLSIVENGLKKSLSKTLKKLTGKEISEAELNKIIKNLDLKNYFKDNTKELQKLAQAFKGEKNDANYGKAIFDVLKLPLGFAFHLIYVLYKMGYVDIYDIAFYFTKKSGKIVVNSLGLLGYGIELIKGEISGEDFEDQIKKLLEKDPETAELILAVMLYRHGGLVFTTLGNISNYLGKLVIYSLTGEISISKTLLSGLKGNVDEYLRVLQKINNIVPPDLKFDGINILRNVINDLEQANQIVKILNENKSISGAEFAKKYSHLVSFIGGKQDVTKLNANELRAKVSNKISSIGGDLDKIVKEVPAFVSEKFKGSLGTKYLLNDFSKQVKDVSKYLSDVVRNDSLWIKFRSQLSKVGLTANMIEIDPLYDKMIFKFKDVNQAKDFIENVGKLAKQSPELVRFLFDKTPLFLVTGLSYASKSTLKDFAKDLMYLVPFIGSGFMLIDALDYRNVNLPQAASAFILFISETGYAVYQIRKGNFKQLIKFLAKPWVDIFEVASFISRSTFISFKIGTDLMKLLTKGELSRQNLLKLLAPVLPKSKRAKIVLLLFFLVGSNSSIHWVNNLLKNLFHKKEIDKIKKSCEGHQNLKQCYNQQIRKNWHKLDNSEKAQLINLAYSLRLTTTKGIETVYEDGKFIVKLTEGFENIPNLGHIKMIKSQINQILQRYGEKTPVEVHIMPKLVKKYFKKEKIKKSDKKREILEAMGYPENIIKELLKPS